MNRLLSACSFYAMVFASNLLSGDFIR